MKKHFASLLLAFCACVFTLHAQILPLDTVSVNWQKMPGIPGMVNEFASLGGKLFAATATGLYVSYDLGENWQRHHFFNHEQVNRVWNDNDTLYLQRFDEDYVVYVVTHRQSEIWRSVDGGSNFQLIKEIGADVTGGNGYTNTTVSNLKTAGRFYYVQVHTQYNSQTNMNLSVHYSFDKGETWQFFNIGNPVLGATFPDFFGWINDTLVGVQGSKIKKYVGGSLDTFTENPLPAGFGGTYWFQDGEYFVAHQSYNPPVFMRTKDFVTAETVNLPYSGVHFFQKTGDAYWLGCYQGIFRSGVGFPFDFQPVAPGDYIVPSTYNTKIEAACAFSGGYFIGFNTGISFRSTDGGATWQRKDRGLSHPTTLFDDLPANIHQSWIGYEPDPDQGFKLWYYSDDGANWNLHFPAPNQPADFYNVHPLSRFGDFWLTSYGWRSYDGGQNWQAPGAGFSGFGHQFVRHGDRVFGFNEGKGFKVSTDQGASWTTVADDSVNDKRLLLTWGDTLVSVGRGASVSYDNGSTWGHTPLSLAYPNAASWSGGKIRLLFNYNNNPFLFASADKGVTWSSHDIVVDNQTKVFLLDKYWCLVEQGRRLFVSANEGLNWIFVKGTPVNLLGAIDYYYQSNGGNVPYLRQIYPWAQDGYLYVLSPAAGIWRTSIAGLDEQWNFALQNSGVLKIKLLSDADCLDNGNETPLPNRSLRLQPTGFDLALDANGEALLHVTAGAYKLQASAGLYEEILCPDSLTAAVPGDTVCLVQRIFRVPDKKDLVVTVIPNGAFRPGFDAGYKILVQNLGTAALSDVHLTTTFSHPLLTFLSAEPPMDEPGAWLIPEIQPGQSLVFQVKLHLDAAAVPGEFVDAEATAHFDGEDETPEDNQGKFSAIITGSYDPNDKTGSSPQGIGLVSLRNPEITYQIRFQNTGTDTAFHIRILDRVDTAAFDLQRFRMIAASHPYQLKINENAELEWNFPGILLPDSTTNEAASHGWLLFALAAKPPLSAGDSLRNEAAIFFDFNAPVLTPLSVTTAVKTQIQTAAFVTLCASDELGGIPFFENAVLTDTFSFATYDSVSVTQVVVLPEYFTSQDTLLPSGATFLGVPVFSDTLFLQNLLTAAGCDSVVATQVSVPVLGTGEAGILPGLQIAPNPVRDGVFIWLKNGGDDLEAVEVFNSLGKRVAVFEKDERQAISADPDKGSGWRISTEGWQPGLYFLLVKTRSGNVVARVVRMN